MLQIEIEFNKNVFGGRDLSSMGTALRCLKTFGGVKEGENVLIIIDTGTSAKVGEFLANAATLLEATPIIMTIPKLPYNGDYPVPPLVAEALKTSDVCFTPTSRSMFHCRAIKDARERGSRLVSMPSFIERQFYEGASQANPERVIELTEHARDELNRGGESRVTSRHGTDVTFLIHPKTASREGFCEKPGDIACFPFGETGVSFENVNGTIVIDTYIADVGPILTPVRWRLKESKIIDISGSFEADLLNKIVRKYGDEGAHKIGEFALGTNPETIIMGINGEDKKYLGSVHFSMGEGRNNESRLHIDSVILQPNLWIEDKEVIREGKWVF
jgi:leucyl aminopeptidase (aminopeptidase T)